MNIECDIREIPQPSKAKSVYGCSHIDEAKSNSRISLLQPGGESDLVKWMGDCEDDDQYVVKSLKYQKLAAMTRKCTTTLWGCYLKLLGKRDNLFDERYWSDYDAILAQTCNSTVLTLAELEECRNRFGHIESLSKMTLKLVIDKFYTTEKERKQAQTFESNWRTEKLTPIDEMKTAESQTNLHSATAELASDVSTVKAKSGQTSSGAEYVTTEETFNISTKSSKKVKRARQETSTDVGVSGTLGDNIKTNFLESRTTSSLRTGTIAGSEAQSSLETGTMAGSFTRSSMETGNTASCGTRSSSETATMVGSETKSSLHIGNCSSGKISVFESGTKSSLGTGSETRINLETRTMVDSRTESSLPTGTTASNGTRSSLETGAVSGGGIRSSLEVDKMASSGTKSSLVSGTVVGGSGTRCSAESGTLCGSSGTRSSLGSGASISSGQPSTFIVIGSQSGEIDSKSKSEQLAFTSVYSGSTKHHNSGDTKQSSTKCSGAVSGPDTDPKLSTGAAVTNPTRLERSVSCTVLPTDTTATNTSTTVSAVSSLATKTKLGRNNNDKTKNPALKVEGVKSRRMDFLLSRKAAVCSRLQKLKL